MSTQVSLPAIMVTKSGSSPSLQPADSTTNDPGCKTPSNPALLRLPTSQILVASLRRRSLAGPLFTTPFSGRVYSGFPRRPSASSSLMPMGLVPQIAVEDCDDQRKKRFRSIEVGSSWDSLQHSEEIRRTGIRMCTGDAPLLQLESSPGVDEVMVDYSTPFPSAIHTSKKPSKRPSFKASPFTSISPVMRLASKETNVISDKYWTENTLDVRPRAPLSASMRAHAGSVDDVTSTSAEITDGDIQDSSRRQKQRSSSSDATRPVHIITCDCGRVLHLRCTNQPLEITSYSDCLSALEASPLPPLQISLTVPSQGHKFKPISEVIDAVLNTTDEGAQLKGCKDLGYYADESTVEVILKRKDAIITLISALNENWESVTVMKEAVLSLLKFAHTSAAGCRYILENGGFEALLKVIKQDVSDLDLDLVSLACKTMIFVSNGFHCEEDDMAISEEDISGLLKLLENYPKDADIHCYVSDLMGICIQQVETDAILHVILQSLLKSLKSFPANISVITKACLTLGSMASTVCMSIASHDDFGTVETVLEATIRHFEDPTVQECGLWALSCITQECEPCCSHFHELTGLSHVLKVMKYYPEDEQIQEYCAWIVGNSMRHLPAAILPLMSDTHVVQLLVNAMTNHEENFHMFTQIAFVIEQAAANSDTSKQLFFELKGVECLVEGMAMFQESRTYQENAISALGNLALDEHLRTLIPQEGAVPAIVDTMLRFEMSESIQLYGCSALANIAHRVTNNKMFIVNNNGVQALVNCIRNFKEKRELVVGALGAMANISGHEVSNLRLVESSSIPHILAALRKYPDDKTVMHLACSILADLVCVSGIPPEILLQMTESMITHHHRDEDNEQQALATAICLDNLKYSGSTGLQVFNQVQGLEVVLKLMQRHPKHVEILKSGCRLITMLVLDGHPGTPVMAEVISYVIKNFSNNETLALLACGALSYLAAGDGFSTLNLLPHLQTIMDIHTQNERVQVVVMLSIRNRLMHRLVLEDIASTLVVQILGTMKEFPENSEIQVSGCEILDILTKSESGKGKLKSSNATPLIVETMKRFDKLQQIQDSGSHMISALSDEFNTRL
ncbi:uncharacterized protein LOC135502420 isoform X2 [Lineus longissimus]|uniref:uncharacterized protein LOC135502420 isoform X2 n=1 Tax=Lineus longissimus TaxID=88925 RepID=UPI00315C5613